MIAVFETSLLRLETDYIDVYFCHIWWDKQEETEAFLRAFEILKRDGKVRAVGVSTHDIQYIKHFNKNNEIDVVQQLQHIKPKTRKRHTALPTGEQFRSCYTRPFKNGDINWKIYK